MNGLHHLWEPYCSAYLMSKIGQWIEKLSVRADGQMDRQTDNYKGHKKLTQLQISLVYGLCVYGTSKEMPSLDLLLIASGMPSHMIEL